MSQARTPKDRQIELERLQELFRQQPPGFEWELPELSKEMEEYLRFCECILERTALSERLLYYLWYRNPSFQVLWLRKTKHTKRDALENAILVRLIVKGITGPTAIRIIYAWWDWHKIGVDEAMSQVLRLYTYKRAEAFAQIFLDKNAAVKEENRLEKAKTKTKSKIIELLRSRQMNAREISDTLGIDHEVIRKQLTRMANECSIARVSRGVYASVVVQPPIKPKPPQLTGEDRTLLFIANEMERLDLTVSAFLEAKKHPNFGKWAARIKKENAEYFMSYGDEEEQPEEQSEEKSWSKAKLPF